MHSELWNKLVELDPAEVCTRASCAYAADSGYTEVAMLNQLYWVDPEQRDIQRCPEGGDPVPADFIEQLCILSYLLHAQNRPLAGKLVKAAQLEAGQFFFRGPHDLPLQPLEQAFGADPQRLVQSAQSLNARPCSFGDASVEIFLFARVPVTFIVWAGDEEFPARASILFDATASVQLPLDALGAAVNLVVTKMTNAK